MVKYIVREDKVLKVEGNYYTTVDPVNEGLTIFNRKEIMGKLIKENLFGLFEELSKYLKDYPLLVEYTADKVLTQEELQALLGLLTFHKEGEVISQGLYDYLIQELKG